jgi:plastocyanin
MRRTLAALTLLAAAGALAVGCGGGNNSSGGGPTTSEAGTPASGTAVTIDNFAFSPASLNVNVGQQVTWTNKQQGVTHTVTADGGRVRPSDAVRSDVLVRLHRAVGWPRWPR